MKLKKEFHQTTQQLRHQFYMKNHRYKINVVDLMHCFTREETAKSRLLPCDQMCDTSYDFKISKILTSLKSLNDYLWIKLQVVV